MKNGNIFCAIRGPIMLITLGSLFALDHMGTVNFERTWPLLIIVFGVLKLAERLIPSNPDFTGQIPPQGGM